MKEIYIIDKQTYGTVIQSALSNYWADLTGKEKLITSLLLAATIINAALLINGEPAHGHDASFHLNNVGQFTALQDSGILYPRWMPESFGGFGSSTLYFYPPLAYVTASIIHAVISGLSVLDEFNLSMLFGSVVSVITMFFYLRGHAATSRASIAALAYGVLPYRYLDVYIRNVLSEHLALAWMPLVLLGFDALMRSTNTSGYCKAIVLLAIAWSLLIASSIPVAAMMIVCAPLYFAFQLRRSAIRVLLLLCFSSVLCMLLSSIYVLPILEFNHARHLEKLWNIFPKLESKYTLAAMAKGTLDSGTVLNSAIPLFSIALAIILYKEARDRSNCKRFYYTWCLLTCVSILIEIPYISLPLYEHSFLFELIQFSSRWNIILTIAMSVTIAISERPAILYLTLLFAVLSIIHPLHRSYYSATHEPITYLDPVRMDAIDYIPCAASADTARAYQFAQQHINDQEISLESSSGQVRSCSRSFYSTTATISLRHAATITFHRFYWPQWKLYANDTLVPLHADSNGATCAWLPSGEHHIKLMMATSRAEVIGGELSILGLVMISALSVLGWIVSKRKPT